MSAASHISIRWLLGLLEYWKVPSDSGNLWTPSTKMKNTVWFLPQLQVTTANWCLGSLLLGQQRTHSFSFCQNVVKPWSWLADAVRTGMTLWSNQTSEMRTDLHVQELQTDRFSLSASALVFYGMHPSMQQPLLPHPACSGNHPSIYQAEHLSIKWCVHIGVVNLFKDVKRNLQHEDSFTAAGAQKRALD